MADKLRCMFTGSRHWTDVEKVHSYLDLLDPDGVVVTVGDCPTGLDKIVREWCEKHRVPHEVFEADWSKHGKAAGPIRNQAMAESGVHYCFAFFKDDAENRGTTNAVDAARRAGAAGIVKVSGE